MATASNANKPLTHKPSPYAGGGYLIAFFSIFFAIGAGTSALALHTGQAKSKPQILIVTGLFTLVGLGGMIAGGRAIGRAKRRLAVAVGDEGPDALDDYLPRPHPRNDGDLSITFRTAGTRWKKLSALIFACLFWNGIVSIFVVVIFREWRGGNAQWCPAAFISIFVLIGLGIFAGVVHQFLGLFNPQPVLTLVSDAVHLGEPFDVAWDTTGNVQRIEHWTIVLEGKELASYRRGTNTVTDTQVFAELVLCDTRDPREMASGVASIVIPPDTMHSLHSANNKIHWQLLVKGEIARWPDINDAFDIVIWPATYEPHKSPKRHE